MFNVWGLSWGDSWESSWGTDENDEVIFVDYAPNRSIRKRSIRKRRENDDAFILSVCLM